MAKRKRDIKCTHRSKYKVHKEAKNVCQFTKCKESADLLALSQGNNLTD
jgi:hypothetical protein